MKSNSTLAIALALLLSLLVTQENARASIIKVSNTTDTSQVVGDLTAYDRDGNADVIVPSDSKFHLGPSIPARESKDFTSKFKEIAKVSISQWINDKEVDSVALSPTIVAAIIPLLIDPLGDPLFLGIDVAQYTFSPPAVGSIAVFSNGLNASYPGWFVGSTFDPRTGDISDPYTGEAIFASEAFTVAAVPEPSSLSLLLTSLGALSFYSFVGSEKKKGDNYSPLLRV